MIKPDVRFRMFRNFYSYKYSRNKLDSLIKLILGLVSNYVFFITGTIYVIIIQFTELIQSEGWILPGILYFLQLVIPLLRGGYDNVLDIVPHTDELCNVKLSSQYSTDSGYYIYPHVVEVGNKIDKNSKTILFTSSKDINLKMFDMQNGIEKNDIPISYNVHVENNYKESIEEEWDSLRKYLDYNYDKSIKNSSNFFNEKKLCLSSSLLLDSNGNFEPVSYHYGDYYSNFLTNIIAGRKVVNLVKGGKKAIKVKVAFPVNNKMELNRLEYSYMCNEIGVSILAVYKKQGKLIIPIPIQNIRNQVGVNQRISSATGGLDDTDLKNDSLFESVLFGMHRELQEEIFCDYDLQHILDNSTSFVTGYHRWINHGGKPEFTGITFIRNVDHHKPNPMELQLDNGNECESQIEFKNLEQLIIEVDKFLDYKNLSLAAYTTLNNIRVILKERPDVIIDLISKTLND